MKPYFNDYFERHRQLLDETQRQVGAEIEALAALLTRTFHAGRKVLIMGNGGSAADAQHFAAELVGRFRRERDGLPAIALTTDTSILTAVGNDYGFEAVFRRQIDALAQANDCVIGISTSGRSGNVIAGMRAAREKGCLTVALLGGDGGEMASIADRSLIIPAVETSLVQEMHIVIIHLLCSRVEELL